MKLQEEALRYEEIEFHPYTFEYYHSLSFV